MATKSTKSAATTELEKAAPQQNMSQRFTDMVLKEYGDGVGDFHITEHQRQLIQNYFIGVDRMLKQSEVLRQERNQKNTNHDYDNTLPFTWNNINLTELALDVVYYSKVGLDLLEDNHLFPIPYKNSHTNKYDITMMRGYAGMEFTAKKYALDPPKDVITELVYSNDTFKPIKKDRNNDVESYEFDITNPFGRGDLIGGFGYIVFDDPTKNKLILMTKEQIEKRKPAKASENFWGKWTDEMYLKTLRRAVYNKRNIPIDPDKVDENIARIHAKEAAAAALEAQGEIETYGNTIYVDVDENTGEVVTPNLPPAETAAPKEAPKETTTAAVTESVDDDPLP